MKVSRLQRSDPVQLSCFQTGHHSLQHLSQCPTRLKKRSRQVMAISTEPLVAEREAPAQRPDRDGRFGRFGGKYVRTGPPTSITESPKRHKDALQICCGRAYIANICLPSVTCSQVPETLIGALKELEEEYTKAMADPAFQARGLGTGFGAAFVQAPTFVMDAAAGPIRRHPEGLRGPRVAPVPCRAAVRALQEVRAQTTCLACPCAAHALKDLLSRAGRTGHVQRST